MNNRLLVIEDNEQNLYLMQFLLQKSGFEVVAAEDGIAGLDLALQCDPLAILLDIQLPKMNGFAVAAELRRHRRLDRVPIIAVTSYAMVGDREQILASGATGYIEKPINPETFVAEIKSYLPEGLEAADDWTPHPRCRR
ncbi:MAG: response regulator [Desulfobulbus sp.]|uniref:response regulator n=1 Tax=Desulfobulbus sp. TaxID=895 RepID=UPI002847BDAF|nr:response regulator [Desulfobulbus sp.]MDR2548892.1 response regulator [Desulfobulbus sp.]